MKLRWRLTLFYTTLLALVLSIIGFAVVHNLRFVLESNAREQLKTTYLNISREGLRHLKSDNTDLTLPVSTDLLTAVDVIPNVTPENFRALPWSTVQALKQPYYVSSNLQPDTPRRANQAPFALTREDFERLKTEPLYILKRASVLRSTSTDKRVPVIMLIGFFPLDRETDATIFDGQVQPSTGILYMAFDLSPTYDVIRLLQPIVLLISIVGVILAGVFAYLLAGRALRPLKFVRDAAESISEKTLRRRVPEPPTGDEVQDLARALNSMLDRLENSFEAQRRFTSDASHELRTPVTAISGHAGYLLRRTNPSAQQSESLTIIKSEADRLSKLIASLLELARSDSGVNPLRRERMLSLIFLDDISRELRPVAQASGAEIRTGGENVEFAADSDKLRQVMINLVSNALKAGAKDVMLSSTKEGSELLLRVADDGPGIPPEHLARLFDRFYRVEESRSRDVGGSGLGLAITKSIVDAHDGIIWIESAVGEGTIVYVKLPIVRVSEELAEEVA
ncbi:sensor histidine kinase [Deinococcus yavapaiensis]|uniref:histidine kinase n=1 Tax=Deinococcus yavapaiensis KR-236 TaxID=694435 RepID=A0A318S2X9_9DEIO|nr:ATP-binding protein [Deinococcus yavapaiensis]PYE50018.1 signal transduction histidine kinase [Deinococcus yavapaiensis KR-236]